MRHLPVKKNLYAYMGKKTRILILIVVAVFFSSCYNYKNLQLLQESRLLPVYEKSEYKDYRIKVNDDLIYRLLTSDQATADLLSPQNSSSGLQNQITYRVYPDSTVDFPFIDSVRVAGLTLSEATQEIESRFRKIIPDATVKLGLGNRTFTVFGDAGSGIFPIYKDKMTIYQALALLGDFNEASDRRHVRIIRDTEKGTQILNFDIRPKSIIDSKYYYVYPNDIIYIKREFSSFYKVSSYSTLLGVITFSVSLLFNVLIYTKK